MRRLGDIGSWKKYILKKSLPQDMFIDFEREASRHRSVASIHTLTRDGIHNLFVCVTRAF